jgi:predicted nucleic acid-binding protein
MNAAGRLIDTNVLVYAYDISERGKRRVARSLLDEVWEEGGGVVTLQNLSEFFVVVTRKVENPIPVASARTIIADVVRSRRWLILDRRVETIMRATEFVEHHGAHFWDALIAACMLEHGVRTIVTENERDFKKIPGISVVNPFKVKR